MILIVFVFNTNRYMTIGPVDSAEFRRRFSEKALGNLFCKRSKPYSDQVSDQK